MTDLKPPDQTQLMREAAGAGRMIEAGWLGLRGVWLSDESSAIQIEEMRNAFFAGAQHMFAGLEAMADDGAGESEAELARMQSISAELERFYADFVKRRLNAPTAHVAAAALGHTLAERIAHDQIDRALRDLEAANGGLSPRDLVLVLSFPMAKLCTHGPEAPALLTIEAMRAALDMLEDAVAKKHPPQGAPDAG